MIHALKAVAPSASDSTLDTLIMGVGAIADVMRVAGANENQSIQPSTMAHLGDLLYQMSLDMGRLKEGV